MASLGVAVATLAPSAGPGPEPPAEAIIARRAFRCLIPHALQSDLGPQGPLLHKGVLVVLQSEHTLLTPKLGWPLVPIMSSYPCTFLLGFFAAPGSVDAFLVILILAGGVVQLPAVSSDPPTWSLPISYGSYEDGSIMSSRMLSTVGNGVAKTLAADDTPIICWGSSIA